MRDLIVVLPGIMGSVLQRDGSDVWNPGLGMARHLLHRRRWVDGLTLKGNDDPANPGFIDGIVPTGLARSTAVVPGLVEIEGYSELHEALGSAFGSDLIEGNALSPTERVDGKDPATFGVPNYFRFAYDWRRDLRASALRLHGLIEEALGNLRSQRSPDAKVIFVAHSMGGLLARCYIEGTNPATGEPFDGWRNVRELFTMGTPYRGAVVAASHLVEGYKQLFINLSAALRSFTGVYQLLPRYKAVLDTRAPIATWIYAHDMHGVSDFDTARARDAYDFHLDIENGVARNRGEPEYRRSHCVPLLGFGHSTINSATLTEDGLTVSNDLPAYLDPALSGGDGTVPLVSAIPIEYDNDRATLRYVNQQHGSLQADRRVLAAEIANRIRQVQAGSEAARYALTERSAMPSLGLDHHRFWLEDDTDGSASGFGRIGSVAPGQLRVSVQGGDDPGSDTGGITVTVTSLDGGEITTFDGIDSGEEITLPGKPGDYRVEAVFAPAQLRSTSAFSVLPVDPSDGSASTDAPRAIDRPTDHPTAGRPTARVGGR